jgi:hypothetical protein
MLASFFASAFKVSVSVYNKTGWRRIGRMVEEGGGEWVEISKRKYLKVYEYKIQNCLDGKASCHNFWLLKGIAV